MHQRKLLLLDTATQVVNGQQVPLKDISAGMTGILLAMHMCHEVDVYGFGQAETYYYPKVYPHCLPSLCGVPAVHLGATGQAKRLTGVLTLAVEACRSGLGHHPLLASGAPLHGHLQEVCFPREFSQLGQIRFHWLAAGVLPGWAPRIVRADHLADSILGNISA